MDSHDRIRQDEAIARGLTSLEEWRKAELIYAYLSFGAEIDTHALVREAWASNKQVAIPYCIPGTRRMRWFLIDSFEGLVRSDLGVEEPVPDVRREVSGAGTRTSLSLVPALCYDRHGYRLGYGKGFYDVFLAGFEGVSVGLCREGSLYADLHEMGLRESHDRPVSIVVSNVRAMVATP